MKRTFIGAVVLVAAVSCATTSSIPLPEELSAALNAAYRGRPVSAVYARYGQPDSQFMWGDDIRVLVWNTNRTMRFHEDVTTTTSGSAGDPAAYPYIAAVPYRETTTSQQGYNVDFSCALQVGVYENGTVHGIGTQGKMGACQNFMPY